jgi:hypothetical protein
VLVEVDNFRIVQMAVCVNWPSPVKISSRIIQIMSRGNAPRSPGSRNGLKSQDSWLYGTRASVSRDLEIASIFPFEELERGLLDTIVVKCRQAQAL